MRKDIYTAITEFEVIAPTNDMEKVGDKFELTVFGEFSSENGKQIYALIYLLDHPLHYRVNKIVMRGVSYIVPSDREFNYATKHHSVNFKYKLNSVR